MFRKMFSYGGPLLLAGAAFFAMPGSGLAQHGGGGHGGGGHFGGGHFGGAHFGGGHFGGAHFGGYHGGFSHYGYHPNYWHNGYRPYDHHYGLYGYYPYLYDYEPYYDNYPYEGSGLTYDPSYYGSSSYLLSGNEAPSYANVPAFVTAPAAGSQADSPPATGTNHPDPIAHVTVRVPAGARVWFDDIATTSTGSTRQYTSPPLTPGERYSYEVRARWSENGREVTQTQKVDVTAGAHVQVAFPTAAKTAGQGSVVPRS